MIFFNLKRIIKLHRQQAALDWR